jgi:Tfp pilus assembly protein PilF
MQKKIGDAKSRYQRALAIDSRAAVAANNLAWLYADGSENLDIALQLAQAAMAQLPDNPDVNDTLGWVYYRKGMASLAVAPLEQSVRTNAGNPLYRFHLGLAYLAAGDKKRARTALEQALTLKPDFEGASEARKTLASL